MVPEPLYQTIFDAISRELNAGTIKSGDRIPPVRELRERFGVSHITVMRAYKELTAAGLIVSHGGKGYFAAEHGDAARKTRRLAVLLRTFRDPRSNDNYFNRLLTGVYSAAAETHYTLITPPAAAIADQTQLTRDEQCEILDAAVRLENDVDGYLFDERISDAVLGPQLERFSKPCVIVNRSTSLPTAAVHPPNREGMHHILDFAVRHGYEHMIYCALNLLTRNELERKQAFDDFIEKHHLSCDVIDGCAFYPQEVTQRNVLKLLADNRQNKILFVSPSDYIGRSVADILTRQKIVFGKTAGIVSFEGLEVATMQRPHLTTLSYAADELGQLAVRTLHDRIIRTIVTPQQENRSIPFNINLGETL